MYMINIRVRHEYNLFINLDKKDITNGWANKNIDQELI